MNLICTLVRQCQSSEAYLKPRSHHTALVENTALWIHASECANHGSIVALVQRVLEQRPDLEIVITSSHIDFQFQDTRIHVLNGFSDTSQTRSSFFASHAPHVVIWVGGYLSASVLTTFQGPQTLSLLVDACAQGFALRRLSFLPNPDKRLLGYFDKVIPIDPNAQDTLTRLGVDAERMPMCGALQSTPLLDQDNDETTAFTIKTGNRLTWYAANHHPDEIHIILSAHEQIVRQSHSTLLLLAARNDQEAEEYQRHISAHNLRSSVLDPDSLPDQNVQVAIVICSKDQDIALHRAAAVSFLGQSLGTGMRGSSPAPAAAVGSALCYGPNSSDYGALYSKLAHVGGARMVNDADTMAQAVGHMLTASTGAAMALSAWTVLTEGADITDFILDLALGHLDDIGV